MANLSPNLSPKEAQAVLDTTTKIMNAQTSQTRNGQVFYPTVVAKQGAVSPQKWSRMSNAEKTLCIMINLCGEIEISKSSNPQHHGGHGGHGSLGALGYSSFKEGNFQSGSKKSAAKFGWNVKSGGKYKSVTDPQLGKDVYAFQHYAEYSSGSSNSGIKTANPPSDPFKDRTDVKNRDGIIGQSTLDMLVAMKNSGYQRVSKSANNIAAAGAELAKKLVANLSHPDLNSPANPALVPQENKKMDCSTINQSLLLAPGSENDPAFKHCADYIRELRARAAASGGSTVKSVSPTPPQPKQPKQPSTSTDKKGKKKTTSTTTTTRSLTTSAEKPWYSIFTENPIITGVGAVVIIGGIAYALSGSDEEVEDDSEETPKNGMGQGRMGYGQQQGQMGYGQQQGQMGGYGQQGQMGYGQQQGQMGYEQPISTPRPEMTSGVMSREKTFVPAPMQEGVSAGTISNPRKRKAKKKSSSSHKVGKGSKRIVGASKKRKTKRTSSKKH